MHKSHIAVLSLSAVTVLAGFQAQNIVTAVGGTYEVDGGAVIRALGACSYTSESVQCWDIEGKANPSLAERIQGYFVGNNNDLTFKLRRKNRLVVAELKGRNSVSLNLQNEGGGYSPTGQIYDNSGNSSLQWLNMALAPEATTTSFQATIYNPSQARTKDVNFRVGEKATFAGANIEIGSVKLLPTPKQPSAGDGGEVFNGQRRSGFPGDPRNIGKWWSMAIGIDTAPGTGSPGATQALDKEGKAIVYVDKVGKPVSAVTYLDSLPRNPAGQFMYNPNPSSKYFMARFEYGNSNVPGAQLLTTNIDPSEIGKIRFTYNPPTVVRFTDIPLDPK